MPTEELWDERDDIEDIQRTLADAGVDILEEQDEVNIDMAEYIGWPPHKVQDER